eukprot:SM000072S21228  [mRNA]  locus=s72:412812:416911:- [translate_table: standard]
MADDDAPAPAAPAAPAEPAAVPAQSVSEAAAAEPPSKASPFTPAAAPIRPDQVENAVNFLSHPKVQGSPVKYRRSFLERKGLTPAEIDEAFTRVPDAPSTTTITTTTTTTPESTYTQAAQPLQAAPQQQQQQPSQQHLAPGQQLVAVQPTVPGITLVPAAPTPAVKQPVRWTQMVLALGILSAAGAGTAVVGQRLILPRLKSWLRAFILDDSQGKQMKEESPAPKVLTPAEQAAQSASAAAMSIAEAVRELSAARFDDRQILAKLVKALEIQTLEVKSALAGIKEAPRTPAEASLTTEDLRQELRHVRNGLADVGSTPTYQKQPEQPYQKQPEQPGLDSIQAQLAQVKELLLSQSAAATPIPQVGGAHEIPGPGSIGSLKFAPTNVTTGTGPSDGQVFEPARSAAPPKGQSPLAGEAAHPQSYLDVLEMVQRGERPPGIREINDKPPNPGQVPSSSRMRPPLKPWEQAQLPPYAAPQAFEPSTAPVYHTGSATASQAAAPTVKVNVTATTILPDATAADSTVPWWRRQAALQEPAPVRPSGVTITELDHSQGGPLAADTPLFGAQYAVASNPNLGPAGSASGSGSGSGGAQEARSGRPGWRPPPAPQPLMPEAAAAIHHRRAQAQPPAAEYSADGQEQHVDQRDAARQESSQQLPVGGTAEVGEEAETSGDQLHGSEQGGEAPIQTYQ